MTNQNKFNVDYLFGKKFKAAKKQTWNVISTNNFSGPSIIFGQMRDNITNKIKRWIDMIVEAIYPAFDEKDTEVVNLGRKAANDWLIENIVKKEMNSKYVMAFFKANKHLDPLTLHEAIKAVRIYVEALQKAKNKPLSTMFLKDLVDFKVLDSVLYTLDKVEQNYLIKFINSLNPGKKLKCNSIIKRPKLPELNHPLVNLCIRQLKKEHGTKELSIKNNVMLPFRKHLLWLTKTFREFNGYSINEVILNSVTRQHLKSYKAYLIKLIKEGEMTELSAKRQFQYGKGVYRRLYRLNKITSDITYGMTNIKAEEYIYRDIPSDRELMEFFKVVGTYSDDPLREQLAFYLMVFCGLRGIEAAGLEWQGINMGYKTFSFKGKNGEWATLPMPTRVYDLIKKIGYKTSGKVFGPNPKSTKARLYRNFKLYTLIAGWNYEGGLHLLRHTFLTKLSKKINDINTVRFLSRHKSLKALTPYIHRYDRELTSEINRLNYKEGRQCPL